LLGAVPEAGREVVLKTVVNDNCGEDNRTVMDLLHPSVVADGARAVRALGVRLAGVDLITRDPGVPLVESCGVFLEVNAPPNFYYHYHKADGAFPVAVHVLRALFADHANRAGSRTRRDARADEIEVDVVHAG
jgi:cyanophycin synthetase